jgi:hypothetical protein
LDVSLVEFEVVQNYSVVQWKQTERLIRCTSWCIHWGRTDWTCRSNGFKDLTADLADGPDTYFPEE